MAANEKKQDQGIGNQRRSVFSWQDEKNKKPQLDRRLRGAPAPSPMSEALFTGSAKFDLAAPFGLENLGSRDTTGGVWVKDGVYDVSTASLRRLLVPVHDQQSKTCTHPMQ